MQFQRASALGGSAARLTADFPNFTLCKSRFSLDIEAVTFS
jgi:hypothetical protein